MDTVLEADHDHITRTLVDALTVAGHAPSVHNTQPWHWRVHQHTADLYADPRRQLTVADLDGRLMTLSCGAALHHACVALAAAGLAVTVTRIPDVTGPGLLASIAVTGPVAVTPESTALSQVITARHTDRRPLIDTAVPESFLYQLNRLAAGFGVSAHILDPHQLGELGVATAWAQEDELRDEAHRAELDAWSGTHRPAHAGVPDGTLPTGPTGGDIPSRDFGHVGTLQITDTDDRAATWMILNGLADGPRGWLRGGEALSAIWLTATAHHIAVLPLSAAVEWPAARRALIGMLSGNGYPYLALRLGTPDPSLPAPPSTPRLPATTIIEVTAG